MLHLHKVLRSSRAAIDLASIMVGVIVIGLIGGVIAATVFAVIPWSQDKAAKQQLDSVHTAQNAFFGLSSDASTTLKNKVDSNRELRNTFADSAELSANSLLDSNSTYCVVPTVDGKDYHAYSKSASGKTFYASNSNKTAVEYTAAFPCVADANGVVGVDPTKDNGTTPVGTVPNTPAPETTPGTGTGDSGSGGTNPTIPEEPAPTVPVSTFNFEDGTTQGWVSGQTFGSISVVAIPASEGHGTKALRMIGSSSGTTKTTYATSAVTKIEPGQKYRVTMWVKMVSGTSVYIGANSVYSSKSAVTTLNTWTQQTIEFTASTRASSNDVNVFGRYDTNSSSDVLIDDVLVEKIS